MSYESERAARAAARRISTTLSWREHADIELGPFGLEGMALASHLSAIAWIFAGNRMPTSEEVRSTWRFVPYPR